MIGLRRPRNPTVAPTAMPRQFVMSVIVSKYANGDAMSFAIEPRVFVGEGGQ